MTFHPAAALRRSAQSIRHAPGLRLLTPVWDRLRAPYRRVLTRLAWRQGIPVMIGGHSIRLSPETVSLNWETVEVEAYEAFAAEVRPGDVVYDVGAHFGTYSLIAVRRGGPSTRVVAYEPCDVTRRFLEKHLRWNGAASQVTVRPVCCGASVGDATYYYRPGKPEGTNGLLPYEDLVSTAVPMTTLDNEVKESGLKPAILKIDVEGAELEVLKGASTVLSTCRPRVFLSLHPERLAAIGLDTDAVTGWLSGIGYRSTVISRDQEIHVLSRPV